MRIIETLKRLLGNPDSVPVLSLPKTDTQDTLTNVCSSFGGREIQNVRDGKGEFVAEICVRDDKRLFAFPRHAAVQAVVLNMCMYENTVVIANIIAEP